MRFDPWTRLALLVVLLVATFGAGCRLYGRVLTVESYLKEMRNHGPLVPAERACAAFPGGAAPGQWTPAARARGSGPASGGAGADAAVVAGRLDALEAEVAALEAELRAAWDRAMKRSLAPAAGSVDARLVALEKRIAGAAAPGEDEIARSIQDGRLGVYRRYVEGQFGFLAEVWRRRLDLAPAQAEALDRVVADVVAEAVQRAGQRQLSELPWSGWNDEEAALTKAVGERLAGALTVEQRKVLDDLVKIPPRRLTRPAEDGGAEAPGGSR